MFVRVEEGRRFTLTLALSQRELTGVGILALTLTLSQRERGPNV